MPVIHTPTNSTMLLKNQALSAGKGQCGKDFCLWPKHTDGVNEFTSASCPLVKNRGEDSSSGHLGDSLLSVSKS